MNTNTNDGDKNNGTDAKGKTPSRDEPPLLPLNADIKEDVVISSPTSINFLVVAAAVVAFTAFWPLLAWLRYENPIGYFDIDTYLALKGVMGDDPGMTKDATEILELPGLSPAEQLVAAFFGPPSPHNR